MKFLKLLFIAGLPVSAVIVWFADKSINQFILFPENLVSYLLQIFGLIGIALLTLNFILSTKSKRLEKIIGGLDNQYSIHAKVGKLGFTIILLHIFNGIIQSSVTGETLRIYLIPGTNEVLNLGIFSFWILVILITLTVVLKLPYHIWKYSHRLMIIPFLLASLHAYLNAYSNNLIPITSTYIILLTIIGCSFYIYVELLFSRIGPVFKYKITNIGFKGNIVELFLEPLNKKINFIPGQYIFTSFLKNKEITSELHPFAISVTPSDPTRISAKMMGDYTNSLAKVKPGDLVKLIGPFGEFHAGQYKGRKNVTWIAGGIGVTPFLSMLRANKLEENKDVDITFIYSVKNKDEAVYLDEIQNQNLSNVKLIVHYSDEMGFINGDYLEKCLGEKFQESQFMICGPSQMMKSINKDLKKRGIKSKNVFFENYSFK